MRNSAIAIFISWQRITVPSVRGNLHLPPKAASASHQDLTAAPYKTLIGQSKRSGIPSPNLFSCLTAEDAQQGAISPEVCTAPMLWSSCSLREAHQDDREPYHRACLPLQHLCSVPQTLQPLTDKTSCVSGFLICILKSPPLLLFCFTKSF